MVGLKFEKILREAMKLFCGIRMRQISDLNFNSTYNFIQRVTHALHFLFFTVQYTASNLHKLKD